MAQKAGATTVTLVFNSFDQNAGWTESWQSNQAGLDGASNAGKVVARARVGFLSQRFLISYIRTSTVQVPKVPPARNQRISFLEPFELAGSCPDSGDGDLVFVAGLVRFYNADKTVFALREFRGCADNFWERNDDKIALSKFQNGLNKYLAAIVAGGMGITHKLPAGGVQLAIMRSFQYERMTHRITGRPLYLPRGRRTR
jgi:hypothetical protein